MDTSLIDKGSQVEMRDKKLAAASLSIARLSFADSYWKSLILHHDYRVQHPFYPRENRVSEEGLVRHSNPAPALCKGIIASG